MRHLIICLFAALWANAAIAFDGQLGAPFDARELDAGEKRFLQAALAHEGYYRARLDGAWGPGSQGALTRAVAERFGQRTPTWQDAATLAKEFARVLRSGKWAVVEETRAQISYLAPLGLMEPLPGANLHGLRTPDDLLRTRIFVTDRRQVDNIHRQVRGRMPNPRDGYFITRDNLLVTAGELSDGTQTYARSDVVGGRWSTTLVEWREDQSPAARLIVASVQTGTQAMLAAPNGPLRRAMRAVESGQTAQTTPAPKRKPAPKQAAEQDPLATLLGLLIGRAVIEEPAKAEDPDRVDAAGLGFYVNNTDLVAPAAIAEACGDRGLRLANGTPLTRLPGGAAMDLALFTSPARSKSWVAIAPDASLNQGAALTAVSLARDGWSTGETATTKAELLGELPSKGRSRRIVASLPARKRSAGAPLFDDKGQLAAIALGKVELPQPSTAQKDALLKVSRAVPASRLGDVLKRNNVLFQSGATGGDPAPAVRPLFCN